MYVYIYICIYLYMNMCVYIDVHIYIHTHTHTYTHIYNTHIYNTHTYIQQTYTYVCIYVPFKICFCFFVTFAWSYLVVTFLTCFLSINLNIHILQLWFIKPMWVQNFWLLLLTKCGPLEKGMANNFSVLAMRILWTVWNGKKTGHWKMNCLGW